MLPSDLLKLAQAGTMPDGLVALDTETSGLFVDDGARVAVVSVAWIDRDKTWEPLLGPFLGLRDTSVASWGVESIKGSRSLPVASLAWAFDQGVDGTGKPEDTGENSLWDTAAKNLPLEEWEALKQWLTLIGENTGLVFHHAKFDLHLMDAGVRRWPGLGIDLSAWTAWDTQNVCHLLWPHTKTTSLKPTSQRLWGLAETDESQLVKSYLAKSKLPVGRWDLVPWEIIGPYADQDARLTIRLYEHQKQAIEDGAGKWLKSSSMGILGAIDRRLDTSLMLFRIERRGLPFNPDLARHQAGVIAKRQAELTAKLPFTPATLPAAKHYWFGVGEKNGVVGLGLKPYAETDLGQPQLNAQVIDKMVSDNVPGADIWRDLQKLNTCDSRWYSGWSELAGPDGRLRASVRQNGTVSSRFSVERVQLQAIPHDYRLSGYDVLTDIATPRQLIAAGVPRGYELWELDLAQAELRVAAMFAKCERMLSLINAGQDLHGEAATQLFGVTADSPDWGKMRNVAKRANFSLIFGVGAEKLQADIETQTGVVLSIDEARKLVRDWNALFPEFQQAIKYHMNVVEDRRRSGEHWGLGWITTNNGERRWFQSDEDTHKAFNQRVQPNLAQFGIDWWLDVEAEILVDLTDDVLYDDVSLEPIGRVGVVMLIHDSMVLLLPEGQTGEFIAHAAAKRGRELWTRFFPDVPGDVDVKRWAK